MAQPTTASAPGTATARTPYHARVHHLETCNCNHGCGCQFGGFPDHGGCEAMVAYEVIEGRYGDVDLTGVKIVEGAMWPGPIHEGGGRAVVFVDDRASDEQVDAVFKILSGQAGGMPFEALAGTFDRVEGPVRRPIEMRIDGRRSTVRVEDAAEVEMKPLQDPVSGEDKDVHITYPGGGFMWDDGAIGTTARMRLQHGDMRFEHPGRFAAYATPTWKNEA